MNALTRLWLIKQKATFRNLFRKPSSAIMTVLMVLIYGFLIVTVLNTGSTNYQIVTLHTAILLSIGFSAIMIFSLLLQKRKALFYENDSFYLFCGPFSRKQVLRFLMSQTLLQSFLFGAMSTFMLICFGVGLPYTPMFLCLSVLGNFLTFLFFMILTDYCYILGISDPKYKGITKMVAGFIILCVLALFLFTLIQNGFDVKNGLMNFAQSDVFYYLPLFGWNKLMLIMCVEGNWALTILALGLLMAAVLGIYFLFLRFKGEFYEQAMMDASELSAYLSQVKEGKKSASRLNAKVRAASVNFKDGAGAIFSKNILLMKKTRDFVNLQDFLILGFYFLISLFTELGFGMYCYMMIIWLFQVLQTSDLVNELKNYQIYLIPAKPFAKLWYALLPTFLKIVILTTVAVVFGGVFYQMPPIEILQYWIMLVGYASVFISGTVLSIRILKSRTNMLMENMMRMLLILLCSLPGIILTVVLIVSGDFNQTKIMLASNLSLVLNLVIALVILYGCKNMMNGRELNSD